MRFCSRCGCCKGGLSSRHFLMQVGLLWGLWGLACMVSAAELPVTLTETADGVTVQVQNDLFTKYVLLSKTKPILWPIHGPDGVPLTRAWPLDKVEKETRDHPHHRSLWFTHGDVNGVDFWLEEGKDKQPGVIEHQGFDSVSSSTGTAPARLVAKNIWKSPAGKVICQDVRELAFSATDSQRVIDFTITLSPVDAPVTFGDTKEGSFGIRVPDSMRVEAKLGGKIVNSQGQVNGAAWGQAAEWVDYHGPARFDTSADQTGGRYGIAILNHPDSFRHPTHWHVREYGLFAANPFGLHDFTKQPPGTGKHTLQVGDHMKLRYRVILHRGDEQEAKIAEQYVKFKDE
ncbi:MAG: PmoA family protein [Pirellulales bacterium]|nr:PmoA family protein [Pirellulales bacterium]